MRDGRPTICRPRSLDDYLRPTSCSRSIGRGERERFAALAQRSAAAQACRPFTGSGCARGEFGARIVLEGK